MADPTPGNPTAQGNTSDATPNAPAEINPGQALDLLGDLEARLGELKTWQAQNDKHVEEVNAQAKLIADQEQVLTERRAQLDAERGELTDERAALEQERNELAEQRNALQGERDQLAEQRDALKAEQADIQQQQEQLQQSREAHDQQTEQLEADRDGFRQQEEELQQRAAGIDSRIAALDARADELDHRQQQLDQQQADVEAKQQAVDTEQAQIQSKWDEVHAAGEELAAAQRQLEESRASLDAERATLADEQAEFAEQRQHLKDRKKDLAKAQMDLKFRQDAIEAQQQSLDRARAELTEQAGNLNDDTLMPGFIPDFEQTTGHTETSPNADALAEQRAALEARAQQLDEQQAELDRQREALAAQQAAAPAGLPSNLEELERELRDREAELEQKENLFRHTLEQSKAKVLNERQKVQDDEKAVQELAAELEQQQAEIIERREAFNARQAELDARAKELEQLKNDFDVRTDSADTVMGMGMPTADPIDDGRDTAAEREEELARKEEAFRAKKIEFREQLELDKQDLATDRAELAERSAEVDQLAGELDGRREQAAQREAELTAWAERLEDQSKELDLRAELAGDQPGNDRDEELALAPAEDNAPDDLFADRIAELDRREAELDQRERDLAEQEADLLQRIDQSGEPALGDDEKDQKIRELSDELQASREKYEKRKAQMMQADEVIKKRRDKVRHYLQLLREQSKTIQAAESKVESSSAQYAGLEKERRNLIEVKKFLEASENAMVQKWATRSTASLVALILIALLGAATFSYFVGKNLAVPVWQSSMAMSVDLNPASLTPPKADPKPKRAGVAADAAVAALNEALVEGAEPGEALPETATAPGTAGTTAEAAPAVDWMTQFRQSVTADPVMNTTLEQLDQRGIRLFTSPAQLASHFAENLTITGNAARIELTYTSEQPEYVVGVLDALGKAIVARQMSIDRAAGQADSIKILQSAERNNTASQDDTLIYMGISFAAIAGIALILGLLIRVALGRSKKIMDEADGIPALSTLDKPGTWSPIGSETGDKDAA